jgi:hypothetical protein
LGARCYASEARQRFARRLQHLHLADAVGRRAAGAFATLLTVSRTIDRTATNGIAGTSRNAKLPGNSNASLR